MKTVNLELVKTALEKVSGSQFEQFANAAFADLIGPDFIPLGGHHDWGADALLCTVTYSKRPHVFFQFSVEEDFRDKIRKTVARLREVKREVNTLYYATSRIIPRQDIVENELGDELEVIVRIRDGGYLTNQVNSSPSMLGAYDSFLAPAVAYLSDLQASPLLADTDAKINPAVYVFLRNELESRESGGSSEGLADGLIIWALRDTGATEGRFLTEEEIVHQIEQDVPGIIPVLGKLIPARLRILSKIPQPQQRPVRHHANENNYYIAFDLRSNMRDENLQAEALRRAVFSAYRVRILAHQPTATEGFIESVSRVSLRTIQRCLEKEGIEFAAFLCGKSEDPIPVKQWVEDCLLEEKVAKADFDRVCEAVEVVLHAALSKPSREERILYSRIASVYTILFCLRTEPRLIQYFERMAGHLHLFIGADVLIQALSERFMPSEQKLFTNTLQLVRSAGGKIVLSEPVLEEMQHHLFAADQEFKHHYLDCEEAITPENLEIINRPLIRAYFKGKSAAQKHHPHNWPQFLNNYCDPHAINSDKGKEELRKYLMTQMSMEFESRKVIEKDCKNRDVSKLAKQLEPYKKKRPLAWNDALMANLVYIRRQEGKEGDDLSGYGLRTWWLTNETAITGLTKELVEVEEASYLMRPDFLLNFLSMLPKKQQAKAIFETLFPSLLGVHLARDHSPAHVDRLHKYLQEVKAVDPARRRVLVAQQSDRLKADLRSVSWAGLFNPVNQMAKTAS
jgi:hypothetical protein